MAESYAIQIHESDLTEEMREQAVAENRDPIDIFKGQVRVVSEWAESVEDRDRAAAIAYAVGEIVRTADDVDGAQTATDTALDMERTESGGFDLREGTE